MSASHIQKTTWVQMCTNAIKKHTPLISSTWCPPTPAHTHTPCQCKHQIHVTLRDVMSASGWPWALRFRSQLMMEHLFLLLRPFSFIMTWSCIFLIHIWFFGNAVLLQDLVFSTLCNQPPSSGTSQCSFLWEVVKIFSLQCNTRVVLTHIYYTYIWYDIAFLWDKNTH